MKPELNVRLPDVSDVPLAELQSAEDGASVSWVPDLTGVPLADVLRGDIPHAQEAMARVMDRSASSVIALAGSSGS